MKKITLITATLLTMALSPVYAEQGSTHRVDKRQARQDARIEQGVQSGQLTEKEAAKLQKGQEHVENIEEKVTADGKVTLKERARLENAQDVQSKRILREKHDNQRDLNHDGKNDHRKPPAK